MKTIRTTPESLISVFQLQVKSQEGKETTTFNKTRSCIPIETLFAGKRANFHSQGRRTEHLHDIMRMLKQSSFFSGGSPGRNRRERDVERDAVEVRSDIVVAGSYTLRAC